MKKFIKSHVTLLMLISSLVLIGIGIFLKEYQSVLTKSIFICLECIGIG